MAITTDDFNKIWASTSPLTPYEFSESNYKEGWNFIGGTPPSRQMWDFLQKNNDEKSQYLLNNFDNYLPLSGGTVTGDLTVNGKEVERVNASGSNYIRYESGLQLCWGELTIPAGTSDREVSDTMTFPYPFANTNYVLTFGNDWCASSNEYYRAEGRNTANFKFTAVGVGANSHRAFYIAIGYWK